MEALRTKFAGLELSSPIIVSSSGLTSKSTNLKKYEDAGAGAIVLKSLFEEQIDSDIDNVYAGSDYPEAMDYLQAYVKDNAIDKHISLIREAKDTVKIPVIASLNCFKLDSWVSFSKEIEAAGADAIEINYMSVETDLNAPYGSMETDCVKMVEGLCQVARVPVIVKLPKYFSNLSRLVRDLQIVGAAAVVLFNRTYSMDIDIDKLRVRSGNIFTQASDIEDSLRYTALVRGAVPGMDLALSTGAHDSSGVIKALLAGASAVQMCSNIYHEGEQLITQANEEILSWMRDNGYYHIDEFVGELAAQDSELTALYLRTQFMKYYSNHKQ